MRCRRRRSSRILVCARRGRQHEADTAPLVGLVGKEALAEEEATSAVEEGELDFELRRAREYQLIIEAVCSYTLSSRINRLNRETNRYFNGIPYARSTSEPPVRYASGVDNLLRFQRRTCIASLREYE